MLFRPIFFDICFSFLKTENFSAFIQHANRRSTHLSRFQNARRSIPLRFRKRSNTSGGSIHDRPSLDSVQVRTPHHSRPSVSPTHHPRPTRSTLPTSVHLARLHPFSPILHLHSALLSMLHPSLPQLGQPHTNCLRNAHQTPTSSTSPSHVASFPTTHPHLRRTPLLHSASRRNHRTDH